MIESVSAFIAQYDPKVVLGAAALVGSLINASITIYNKKRELKDKFEFQPRRLIDTVWQSTVAGATMGLAIGANAPGIVIALLTGVGIDTATNKTKILNLAQIFFDRKDKKAKKSKKK